MLKFNSTFSNYKCTTLDERLIFSKKQLIRELLSQDLLVKSKLKLILQEPLKA